MNKLENILLVMLLFSLMLAVVNCIVLLIVGNEISETFSAWLKYSSFVVIGTGIAVVVWLIVTHLNLLKK